MARPLAVEREAVIRGANLDDLFASAMEAQRFDREAGYRRQFSIGRLERGLREGREDVGEE